jgi:hypothetical protein
MKIPFLACLYLCTWSAVAQSSSTLSVAEISKLLPDKIMKGYNPAGNPNSKVMKVGTLKYALAEKKFSSGPSKIRIMVFDYAEAGIMYSQATGKFSTYSAVESDSAIMRPLTMANANGWGSENSRSPSSQITLGINNRYYLILEGEKTRLEELEKVLEYLDLDSFPK